MKVIEFNSPQPLTKELLLGLLKDAAEQGKVLSAEFSEQHMRDVLTFPKQASADGTGIVKQAADVMSSYCGNAPVTIGKTTRLFVG